MNKLRIKEAIALHNFRQQVKNFQLERPDHIGKTNQSNIARLIYPNMDKEEARKKGYKLASGDYKTIKPEWVDLICKETGVDPNFLFGEPSKHDKEFDQNVLPF